MTDEDGDLLGDMHDALCSALAQYERAMVTKWVVCVESVEEDGARGLWVLAMDGMKPWDVAGLLKVATDRQTAQIIRGDDE